jgi:tricorn protease-like protein
MRHMSLTLLTLLLMGMVAGLAMAQTQDETHPFSIHDMLAMDRISDPQVSPDGKWIVFTLRKTDMEANRGRTDLYLVGTDGKGLRRLTSHPAGDFNPRWSRSGWRGKKPSCRSETSGG